MHSWGTDCFRWAAHPNLGIPGDHRRATGLARWRCSVGRYAGWLDTFRGRSDTRRRQWRWSRRCSARGCRSKSWKRYVHPARWSLVAGFRTPRDQARAPSQEETPEPVSTIWNQAWCGQGLRSRQNWGLRFVWRASPRWSHHSDYHPTDISQPVSTKYRQVGPHRLVLPLRRPPAPVEGQMNLETIMTGQIPPKRPMTPQRNCPGQFGLWCVRPWAFQNRLFPLFRLLRPSLMCGFVASSMYGFGLSAAR